MSSKPSCLVLGGTGFIGRAVIAEAKEQGYQVTGTGRADYDKYVGNRYDLVINANGNSKKFIDRKDPKEGFEASVNSVLNALLDFPCDRYVQLSSGAVYPDESNPENNRETEFIPAAKHSTAYGLHKWLAEELVRYHHDNALILRLGGFVGEGLSKNAIYDMITGGPLFVHPDSAFQIMNIADLARIIFELLKKPFKNETINVSTRGCTSLREFATMLPDYSFPEDADSLPLLRAELNVEKCTKLVELPTTNETLQQFLNDLKSGDCSLS